jgi:hypothetical protein
MSSRIYIQSPKIAKLDALQRLSLFFQCLGQFPHQRPVTAPLGIP